MRVLKIKLSFFQEIGLFAMMCAVLTFLSSYYGFIGRPLYYLGLLIAVISVLFNFKRTISSGIGVWYICFLVCMLFSALYSIDSKMTVDTTTYLAGFQLPILLAVVAYCKEEKNIDRFLIMYLLAAIILSVFVIKDGSISVRNMRFGMTTTGEQPNTPAMNLAPAIAFALYYYRRSSGKRKILYVVLMALFIGTIFLTGSRKILIYIIGIFVINALFNAKDFKKTLARVIGVIVLLIIGYIVLTRVPVLYSTIGRRVFTDLSEEASSVHRSWLLTEAWNSFLKDPIIGHGAHTFKLINVMGRYAHNNYAELLAGMGIIGLVAHYGYLVYITYNLWKYRSNSLCQMMFGVMLMSFVIDYWNVNFTQRGIYFIYAIAYVVYRIAKQESKKECMTNGVAKASTIRYRNNGYINAAK